MIYVNKIENRVTFKMKTGYYLDLLTPETMKLLGSTKSKINRDKDGENVSHLEITEVALIHCTIVNNNHQISATDYGFLSFAKTMHKNIGKKISKSLSSKYFSRMLAIHQKLLDHAKKSETDALKTSSKTVIQKTAETTGDFIGNKITNKMTNV